MTEDQIQSIYDQAPSMTVARDGVVRKLYGNSFSGWTYVDFEEGKAVGWGVSSPYDESQQKKSEVQAEINSTVKVID